MLKKDINENVSKIASEILAKVIDVSQDTDIVLKEIDVLKNRIFDKDLGNLEIENLLNGKTNKFGIKFESGWGDSADADLAQLGIVKAYTAENGSIGIVYNNYFWESFKEKDDQIWKTFLNSLKNLISHELIHRKQLEKIRSNVKTDYKFQQILQKMQQGAEQEGSKYFSQSHELMTFANEAVNQYRNVGYTDNEILKRIKRPFDKSINPAITESNVYYQFSEYFDAKDVVFKKFLQYMWQYLK